MESNALRLELNMDATVPLVSVTRRFVERALEKFVSDGDLVSRVAMTAHELLENVAKYGARANAELSVTMDREEGNDRNLTVRVSNAASPADIERLNQSFSELNACDDPLELYLDLMRRNATNAEISGLGLARILAEGEMTLGLTVNGDAVTIVAQTGISDGCQP